MVLKDGELVDDEPVVFGGFSEIEEMDNVADDTTGAGVFDGETVNESAVKGAVGGDEGGGWEQDNLFKGVLEGGGGQPGVKAGECGAQAGGENDLLVRLALGADPLGVDILTTGIGVAQAGEPADGGLLDEGFGKVNHL